MKSFKHTLMLLLTCLILINGCRKDSPKYFEVFEFERNWIHENGGTYKNEKLLIKLEDGSQEFLKLNWEQAKKFRLGDEDYCEVPFSESEAKKHIYANSNSNQKTIFSFMIRKTGSKIEASIKVTFTNYLVKGEKKNLNGIAEFFYKLDGTPINGWFRDQLSGQLFTVKRKNLSNNIKSNSNEYVRQNLYCDYYSINFYDFRCWATGGQYNDTACGWVLVLSQVFIFCIDDGSGASGGVIWPPSPSGTGNQAQTRTTPCDGDVIKNPTIARSSATNINGGRFGPTRIDAKTHQPKWHYGTDLFAVPNTSIYAAYGGVVKRVISHFPSSYYSPNSFGNLIEIESTLPDGSTISMLYAHLNSVEGVLLPGNVVQQNQMIGLSGRTGNAQRVAYPHVHVQVSKNGVKVNPENYLATKFNTNGSPAGSPCN